MSTTTTEVVEFDVLPPEVQEASTALSAPATKVAELFKPFAKPFEHAASLLAEEEDATTSEAARALRLKMVKARTAIGATKDEAKSDLKFATSAIDWFHNKGRDKLAAAEARLREIEEAEARAEAARKEALRIARTAELEPFGVDGKFYNLGEMPADGYDQLLASSKLAYEARIEAEARAAEAARIEAEREIAARVERERVEAEERARIEAENAKLKAEAKARELELAAGRAALLEAEAEARKERERLEAEAKAAKAKADAIEKEARLAREKAEADAKAAAAAEAKRKRDEARERSKAAKAPDKEKLIKFAAIVRALHPEPLTTDEGKAIAEDIGQLIVKLAKTIETKAELL